MTFRNPILGAGGSTLLRPAIQSPNYVPGLSGWTIQRTGSAEFNNITIRNGETVSSTALYYSGTPAAGNLVASIASTDGMDEYGNPYGEGTCVYNPGSAIFAQLSSGILRFGTINGAILNTTDAAAVNTDAAAGILEILSPADPTGEFPNRALVELISGLPGVTVPGTAEPYLNIHDPAQSSVVSMYLSGALVKTTVGGTPRTWQTPNYAATGTNWAGGSVAAARYAPLQYRLDAEDNLHICGTAHATAALAAGSYTLFSLAAPYIPKKLFSGPAIQVSSADAWKTAVRFNVDSTGSVGINTATAIAANDGIYVNVTVPLGNIT
jgi:hypothetical protein